ncbi:hypothetical protein, partial [Alistipes putredinis]|uniref:hypothetical protein n=1 Tax=Alistipes putredinis TaxID=28117 RepID=UPI003A8E26A2
YGSDFLGLFHTNTNGLIVYLKQRAPPPVLRRKSCHFYCSLDANVRVFFTMQLFFDFFSARDFG